MWTGLGAGITANKTAASNNAKNFANYQPKGDYVKKNTDYAIKVGAGNYTSGATPGYVYGSGDHYRMAWSGSSNARFSFVDPGS